MDKNSSVKNMTRASMFIVVALIITFMGARFGTAGINQWAIGPLVNAVIILAILFTDLKFGLLVSLSTPVLALITGQFTIPPFTPFIMAGNAVLTLVFFLCARNIKKYGKYMGILFGAILKTAALTISIRYLVRLFKLAIPEPAIEKLTVMMFLPQFYSAIVGGIAALFLYSLLRNAIGDSPWLEQR